MSESTEILQRLTRVETKLDMILEDREVAANALEIANAAAQSSRAAHKRLNTHSKIMFWAGTTIITSEIGIILFLIERLWGK